MHTFRSCSVVEVSRESLDTAPFKRSPLSVPDEKSVCSIGGIIVVREDMKTKLPHCIFIHYVSCMDYTGNEPGASAMRRRQRPELWHGVSRHVMRHVGSDHGASMCAKLSAVDSMCKVNSTLLGCLPIEQRSQIPERVPAVLSAVYRTDTNAFRGTVNYKPPCLVQCLEC